MKGGGITLSNYTRLADESLHTCQYNCESSMLLWVRLIACHAMAMLQSLCDKVHAPSDELLDGTSHLHEDSFRPVLLPKAINPARSRPQRCFQSSPAFQSCASAPAAPLATVHVRTYLSLSISCQAFGNNPSPFVVTYFRRKDLSRRITQILIHIVNLAADLDWCKRKTFDPTSHTRRYLVEITEKQSIM